VGIDIGGAEDGYHTRHAPGSLGVNVQDAGVGVWATQHRHIDHALEVDIGCIYSLTGNQGRVFPAANPGADELGNTFSYAHLRLLTWNHYLRQFGGNRYSNFVKRDA
jgi:hypothetical protein